MKTEIRKELSYILFLLVQVAFTLFAMNYALLNWVLPSAHNGMQFLDFVTVSIQFIIVFTLFIPILTPLNLLADVFANWAVIGVARVYFRFR